MNDKERQAVEALIQEGRNQALYLLLAIGDENVASSCGGGFEFPYCLP